MATDFSNLEFNNTYSTLPSPFFTAQPPTPTSNPVLIAFNQPLARAFGFTEEQLSAPDLAYYLSGHQPFPGMNPLAMKYAGHQFGSFNPHLGDGRGLLLGEIIATDGQKWDLHLKGAGPTPYSRSADGRAVLRSSIREYLCSEAMYHLGIPTSRALSLTGSDERVLREMPETAATVIRVAQSHIRFGHFEHFFYNQQHEHLKTLVDYVIEHHFPDAKDADNPCLAMLTQVIKSTAEMVAKWQTVGFAHGVMNTDNMSILGITFDYGPFGFMDDYSAGFICNHSDYSGRYAFDQQPKIALWNLSALAYALTPFISTDALNDILETFYPHYHSHYNLLMSKKLGLMQVLPEDEELITELINLLNANHPDYTTFFRNLALFDVGGNNDFLRNQFFSKQAFDNWAEKYRSRLARQSLSQEEKQTLMNQHNPKYILRNYLAQQAIEKAENGDFSLVNELSIVLEKPFDEQPEYEKHAQLPPDWGKSLAISCSS